MKKLTLALSLSSLYLTIGCSEALFQTSETSNRKVLEQAPEMLSDDFIAAMKCTSAGKTTAKLLSSEVVNGDPDNNLKYEISLTDCDGNPKGLETQYLLFDIKAVLKTYNRGAEDADISMADIYTFGYEVDKAEKLSGDLTESVGQDLFGESGPNKLHWRSTGDFNFPKTETSFIITVSLNGLISFPEDVAEGFIEANQLQDEFMIDTYLRLGRALPVRVTVPFKNIDKDKISTITNDAADSNENNNDNDIGSSDTDPENEE